MNDLTRRPIPSRRRWLTLVLIGFGLVWPSESSAQRPELLPIPEIELTEGAEASVQEVFPELLAAIDEVVADEISTNAQLAEAFGTLGRAALYYEIAEVIGPALENARRLEPSDFRWPYYLGAYYQDQRRVQEAVDLLERAHELKPDDPAINLRLGQLALLSDDPSRAPEYFERVRGTEGFQAAALYGLGRSASLRGDDAAAIELFKAALELEPEAAEIHQQLGLTYRKQRDLEAAREHLSKQVSGSLTFPDPLMATLRDDFSRSYLFAGVEAQLTGRWDEAVADYRKAVELDPDSGLNHHVLAAALEKTGELDEAIEEYRLAVSLLPNDAMPRVMLGKALSSRDGVTEEVVSLFREAVEMAPGLKDSQKGLGSVLLQQQRFGEALEHLDAAVDIDPEDPGARLLRARAMAALGREAEARSDLEMALEYQPEFLEATLDLAAIEARQGEFVLAIDRLQRVLSVAEDANSRGILNFEIGGLWQLAGDDLKALESYDAAIRNSPELKDAHFNRAVSLGRLGRQAEAEEELLRVLELDPNDAGVYLALAQAGAAQGRFVEARQTLESGLEQVNDDPQLMAALVQLLLASPDPEARDAAAAVPWALRAFEENPTTRNAAMVAAALGASGRSSEAVDWQARVLKEAESAGWPEEQLQRIRSDLALYRQRAEGGNQ